MPATTSEPMVSARNGCTLNRVMSTTISAMPTSAAMISRAPEAGGAVGAWASRTGSTVAVKAGLLAGQWVVAPMSPPSVTRVASMRRG